MCTGWETGVESHRDERERERERECVREKRQKRQTPTEKVGLGNNSLLAPVTFKGQLEKSWLWDYYVGMDLRGLDWESKTKI
jgi:hypothetical protein